MLAHPPRNLGQLRQVLAAAGAGPKKSLGQNFMVDQNLRDAIVRDAGVTAEDVVLEVGVGLGILTEGLLDVGAHVIGVELDDRMVEIAGQLLAPYLPTAQGERAGHLTLVHGNVLAGKHLATAVTNALDAVRATAPRLLMVSNLPYNLASTVLVAALEWRPSEPNAAGQTVGIDGFAVLVQHEVAERLTAAPATELYGGLSILTRAHADVRITRKLPGRVFFPPPKVDSGFVVGTVREPAAEAPMGMSAAEYAHFKATVHAAFQYRRKKLAKSLALGLQIETTVAKAAMERMGLGEDVRGEQLSPEQFVALSRQLRAGHPDVAAD